MGILELCASKRATRSLFDALNDRILCKGFPISCEKIARDAKGYAVGITEEWHSGVIGTAPMLHLRSLNCKVLLQRNYNRTNSLLSAVKRNSTLSTNEKSNFVAKKRESYMSQDELKKKLQEEQNRRRNAERRLNYMKDKMENEMKSFTDEDHIDFLHMFQKVDQDTLNEDMKIFWEAQRKALEQKNLNGHRWHPKVIRLCLSIWNRSPEAYKELRESGVLVLPSGRLLRMYKNSCSQNPGLNESVGQWMRQESIKRRIGPEGREGGIILDEMAIQ
ncbi:Hypothetical predicted protein, partial [Paramuricea clavata]